LEQETRRDFALAQPYSSRDRALERLGYRRNVARRGALLYFVVPLIEHSDMVATVSKADCKVPLASRHPRGAAAGRGRRFHMFQICIRDRIPILPIDGCGRW